MLRTGCPWRYLPANFPPWQTVFSHFRRLRDPRDLDALVTGVAPPSTPADKEGILTQVPKAGILKA
jgi:transposase